MEMVKAEPSLNSANGTTRSSSPVDLAGLAGIPGMERDKDRATYLQQLIKDQKTCLSYPNVFHHVERLLAEEIVKVRSVLFQNNTRPLELPSPTGKNVTLSKKVFVPQKDYPDYNFVGRILGPRGLTAKQLEQETGCKIMVRGKGSMRDKKKEEQNRGRPNWEHLNEELHVLITVEDSENRADVKLLRAIQEIEKLLIPAMEGEDDLKKKQLMELAIINGTYRDNSNGQKNGMSGARLQIAPVLQPHNSAAFRLPNMAQAAQIFPGLVPNTASILRPQQITSMNGTGTLQGIDQTALYYAPMEHNQYNTYINGALTGALMPNGIDYSSQNVSPHEGLIGESPHATPVTHAHGLTHIQQPRLLVNGNHKKE